MKFQKLNSLKPYRLATWLILIVGLGLLFAWKPSVAKTQGSTAPIVDAKVIKDTTSCNLELGGTGWERIDTDLNLGLDGKPDPV